MVVVVADAEARGLVRIAAGGELIPTEVGVAWCLERDAETGRPHTEYLARLDKRAADRILVHLSYEAAAQAGILGEFEGLFDAALGGLASSHSVS